MTEAEILGAIEEVAREHVGWDGELKPSMDLIRDLQLDSLRVLALAVHVENHFGIQIDPEDGASIQTVGDLASVVQRKL